MTQQKELSLDAFAPGSRALVIGASGGIGEALVHALKNSASFSHVYAAQRKPGDRVADTSLPLDLEDEQSIEQAVKHATADGPLSLVITATGLLHDGELQPEKSWRSLSADNMARSFAVNCTGPALVLKHVLPTLARHEHSVVATLSARVGSISDNRLGGWYAYRSAKAALNMVIKTASIELARTKPSAAVVGLHPGTVNTTLSQPFQANVPEGKLFDRSRAAHQLLTVLNGITRSDSGKVFDWRGHEVPA